MQQVGDVHLPADRDLRRRRRDVAGGQVGRREADVSGRAGRGGVRLRAAHPRRRAAGLQGLFLDPSQLDGRFRLSLGVGRFLDPDTVSPLLLAIVGRVDLITIWITVLVAIGLCVTGRIPLRKAAIAAAIVWLVGGLPLIHPGASRDVGFGHHISPSRSGRRRSYSSSMSGLDSRKSAVARLQAIGTL